MRLSMSYLILCAALCFVGGCATGPSIYQPEPVLGKAVGEAVAYETESGHITTLKTITYKPLGTDYNWIQTANLNPSTGVPVRYKYKECSRLDHEMYGARLARSRLYYCNHPFNLYGW